MFFLANRISRQFMLVFSQHGQRICRYVQEAVIYCKLFGKIQQLFLNVIGCPILDALLAGTAFLLGAQPPQAQTLELWDAVAGHADVTEVENAVMQWLEFIPLVFAEQDTADMSLLTLDLLEVI